MATSSSLIGYGMLWNPAKFPKAKKPDYQGLKAKPKKY